MPLPPHDKYADRVTKNLVTNPHAYHDYEVSKTIEAGLVLTGGEVKSLRLGQASLKGAHVKVVSGEAYLLNAQITPYAFADRRDLDPKRTRKILLHKREVIQLLEVTAKKGWAVIPLSVKAVGRRIKLTLGVGRGKKEYEKRAQLKKRAIARDVARELKQKIRVG